MGTATYMSPEQARGQQVDARTDIFSLGVVIYELLTGHLPFEGSSIYEVVASILSDQEAPPLSRYSPEVPAELERIVAKTLRKNREERYQTIKDLLLDLQSLRQRLEFERTHPAHDRCAPYATARLGNTAADCRRDRLCVVEKGARDKSAGDQIARSVAAEITRCRRKLPRVGNRGCGHSQSQSNGQSDRASDECRSPISD